MIDLPAEAQEAIRGMWDPRKVPGFVAGIYHEGQLLVSSEGVTSMDHPLPVTPDTIFQIGSISKTFVAAAVVRLVEGGMLALEAPVRRYMPDFRVADPEASERATVQDLLTHYGGWEGDFFLDTGTGPDALSKYVEELAAARQLIPTGTHFSYNNAAFNVAGRLIEVASGMSFEQAIESFVLEPIALKHTFFEAADVITERFAVGHHLTDGKPAVARPWPLPRASYPAGGVATDIQDLLRYAASHLVTGATVNSARGFSAESIALMHTPRRPIWGAQESVGLAWFLTETDAGWLHSHQGATNGQVSSLYLVPKKQFAVAVLTNSSSGAGLTHDVTAWVLKHYLGIEKMIPSAAPYEPPDLGSYLGVYERPFARLEIAMPGPALVANVRYLSGFPSKEDPPPPNPPEMPLAPWAEDRFIVVEGPSKDTFIDFFRDSQGEIQLARASRRIHKRLM